MKTLTIAVNDTDYGRWDGDEHWSLYQPVDWDSLLEEFEVKEGDDQWGYMEGIQRFLREMETLNSGYKAPKLKFCEDQLHLRRSEGLLDGRWRCGGRGERAGGQVEDGSFCFLQQMPFNMYS